MTSAEVSKTATQTDAYTKEEEELMKFNSKKKKKGKGGKEDKPKKMRKKKKKKENEDSDDEDGGFDVSKLESDELAKEANGGNAQKIEEEWRRQRGRRTAVSRRRGVGQGNGQSER